MVCFNGLFRILAVCALSVSVGACGSSGTSQALSMRHPGDVPGTLHLVDTLPPPPDSAGGLEQPLMPSDVLAIEVFRADQLSRTVQIDSMGRISLPLVGTVAAAGKTLRGLEQEIADLYGARYLQDPEVTVFLKESAGQRITVDGEVAKPGLFPVSSNTTLLDAIALAGGFRELADQQKVYVFRPAGEEKLVANYDVASIRKGRAQNPRVYGGDVLVVLTSQSRVAMNNLKEALGLSARVAAGIAVMQ